VTQWVEGVGDPFVNAVLDSVASLHPLGRYITAEYCAAAGLFLASDEAMNITGVLLPVDGGYVAR
jgi:enoyl-[acyl-carrier-protein] reductase (NADH)